jgi:hypothetical protein
MNERYPIETVADFAKIPRDRLAICLREFAAAVEAAAATVDLVHAIQAATQPDVPRIEWPLRNFIWTDDDKGELKITFVDGRGPEPTE